MARSMNKGDGPDQRSHCRAAETFPKMAAGAGGRGFRWRGPGGGGASAGAALGGAGLPLAKARGGAAVQAPAGPHGCLAGALGARAAEGNLGGGGERGAGGRAPLEDAASAAGTPEAGARAVGFPALRVDLFLCPTFPVHGTQ